MNAKVRKTIRTSLKIATAACLAFAVAFGVYAAGYAAILEQRVVENALHLYIKYNGEAREAEAQIGTEAAEDVTVSDLGDTPIVTWLLVDNSLSIDETDREKTKELLTNLVAGRVNNERFNLCTYDESLRVILQDNRDYAALKAQINAIEYKDQESYLTDVLAELIEQEEAREESAYVRVIVVGDGVDNNPEGLTRDELNRRLADCTIPVYTLGCKKGNNDLLLKELYSLSRQTGAQSWTLSDLPDTLEVARAMCQEEVPICAVVTIPPNLRDGSAKGVQLTLGDGTIVKTQAVMPFGELAEDEPPTAEPESNPAEGSPEETESAPETEPTLETEQPDPFILKWVKDNLILSIVLAALVLAGIGTTVFLLIRKKEKRQIKPVGGGAGGGIAKTDILPNNELPEDRTVILVNDDSRLMLSLTDCANPDKHFEAPLRGRVSIGRSASNQIVLDYDRSVSGEQCEIFIDGSTFKIRNLSRSNGTFVDGMRIIDTTEIANGSVIKLGRLEMAVEIR